MRPKMITQRGQALILIALAMVGLVAIVGLAIDGGAKFSDRRHAQNAADTAALAAALAKVDMLAAAAEPSSTVTTSPEECPPPSGFMSDASDVCAALMSAGLGRAQSNGYDNITNNTVKIYSPPISGYYAGDENYVQVVITSTVNTTFARVIGRNQLTNIVEAVAFAKPGFNLTEGAMIISYDPDPNCSETGTGGYSVQVNGSATVNLIGGGIFLNSDEVCGFKIPSCADLNITNGGAINTVGTDNINTTGCTFDPPLTKNYEQDPVIIPDDVNELWPPVPKECSMIGSPTPTKLGVVLVDGKEVEEWLIYPGFYPEFPQATLLPTAEEVLVGKRSRIYMASGVYCIDPPMNQDLSWSPVAASMLVGSTSSNPSDINYNKYYVYNPDGVTLYIRKGGGFKINLDSPTYLDASNNPNGPNGDYQGYLIILEGISTDHPACVINGGAQVIMNGLIFAPYCNFTINGGGVESAPFNAQLIGWDILIDGKNGINFNYNPSNQVKIKRKVGLMK